MRTFLSILKNNYCRTIPRIAAMSVITIITMLTILLAVYMTGVGQIKGRIAYVTEDSNEADLITSPNLSVTVVSRRPLSSALLQHKYDAFVTKDNQGKYQIETLKNEKFQQTILHLLENPEEGLPEDGKARGVGVNIVGYMMMFLLIISVSNLFAFAEDKEQGQLRRIAAAPVSFVWYLGAQYVYCISLFIPEYLMLVLIKLCGGNIGFSLGEYAILMGLLALLGISFGLVLHTFIQKPDNANMLGNSVAVLTSILAGSFYSFTKDNSFFDRIIELVPQRQLMNLALKFQNNAIDVHESSILYILVVSLVLFGVSVISLRSQYVKSV